MNRFIILDSGPLSLLCAPASRASTKKCRKWFLDHKSANVRFVIPEIADYEVRRELLRTRSIGSIRRLDALTDQMAYLTISTTAMRMAAEMWAQLRLVGLPTASEHDIDGDCILAGQIRSMQIEDFIVATTNVRHIARLVPAATWESIELTMGGSI